MWGKVGGWEQLFSEHGLQGPTRRGQDGQGWRETCRGTDQAALELKDWMVPGSPTGSPTAGMCVVTTQQLASQEDTAVAEAAWQAWAAASCGLDAWAVFQCVYL